MRTIPSSKPWSIFGNTVALFGGKEGSFHWGKTALAPSLSPQSSRKRSLGTPVSSVYTITENALPQQSTVTQSTQHLLNRPVKIVCSVDGEHRAGLGGQDVELGHGLCSGCELCAHAFFGTPPLAHVAIDAAVQADRIGCVDVHAKVEKRDQLVIVERENAFHNDELFRCDGIEGIGNARVDFEIVDRALDGKAVREIPDVLDEELAFKRIRMIEVLFVARVQRELRQITVVQIQREKRGIEHIGKLTCECGFAGAGTARDAENYRTPGRSRGENGVH